ncbi:RICIN domain-containing protein [Actinomadura hibisca]|uniref:RICIN domain-containing protein n=1 Tax=Actinomadura hibisca TaxID=68565 RepID=UPI000832BFA8|nr:RICIN domain-containing protein [Actinomadura hibisca]
MHTIVSLVMKAGAVGGLMAAAGIALLAPSAHADGWVTWKNAQTGTYMANSASRTNNGNPIIHWPANGNNDQQWYSATHSDGSKAYVNGVGTNKALDGDAGHCYAPMVLWDWHARANQRWWRHSMDGGYMLQRAQGCQGYLPLVIAVVSTSRGGQLYTREQRTVDNWVEPQQRWK